MSKVPSSAPVAFNKKKDHKDKRHRDPMPSEEQNAQKALNPNTKETQQTTTSKLLREQNAQESQQGTKYPSKQILISHPRMTMYGTARQDSSSLLSGLDTHRLPDIVVITDHNICAFAALSLPIQRESAHTLHRGTEDNIIQIVEGSVIAHKVLHVNSLLHICMTTRCGPNLHLQGKWYQWSCEIVRDGGIYSIPHVTILFFSGCRQLSVTKTSGASCCCIDS